MHPDPAQLEARPGISKDWLAVVIGLFIFLLSLTTFFGADQKLVELRRFPYPYQAALAICSDIDETESVEEFLAVQAFLSSTAATPLGPGLGLEIGNSCWFYNQYAQMLNTPAVDSAAAAAQFSGAPDLAISVFRGTSDSLSSAADVILALMKAGYIDCLHSYGHFTHGDFTRGLAQRATQFLDSVHVVCPVWINHGGVENEHNIGRHISCRGDDSGNTCYHTDITIPRGTRFVWQGQVTHCVGQDGDVSLKNLVKSFGERILDLCRPGGGDPHDNGLVHVCRLDDGRAAFEFVRFINPWGKYADARPAYWEHQLSRDVIDELIGNRGYMIFYTHVGKNDGPPYLPESAVRVLQYINEQQRAGRLLVTTTSRLLNYHIHSRNLHWREHVSADSIRITIDTTSILTHTIYIGTLLSTEDVMGITFYIPENKSVSVSIGDTPIAVKMNPPDETGRHSVSIPWRPLHFPDSLVTTLPIH